MQKYSSERGNCRLTMAKELFAWKPMYFAVPKSSPYQEEINREYNIINIRLIVKFE